MEQQQGGIVLIGMGIGGIDGLTSAAWTAINQAELMIGHQRHLDLFPEQTAKKTQLGSLPELVNLLKNTTRRAVVLASGDPLFFGVGRYLLKHLPRERIRIISNISSVQYAFAMIREPWDDAVVVSVHGRALEDVLSRIAAADKVCILTDQVNSPKVITAELQKLGLSNRTVWICEDLGMPTEKITSTNPDQISALQISDLNILIIIKNS